MPTAIQPRPNYIILTADAFGKLSGILLCFGAEVWRNPYICAFLFVFKGGGQVGIRLFGVFLIILLSVLIFMGLKSDAVFVEDVIEVVLMLWKTRWGIVI